MKVAVDGVDMNVEGADGNFHLRPRSLGPVCYAEMPASCFVHRTYPLEFQVLDGRQSDKGGHNDAL